MARAVRITLIALVALAAVLSAVALFLFRTASGHAVIKPVVESALGDALGGKASIGGISGALPGDIVLTDVRLADESGAWLVIDRIELDWDPAALVRRRVAVDSLSIVGGALLRDPPQREQKDKRPRGFQLPDRLPFVRVESLDISGFRIAEAVVGSPMALDAEGAVRMGGRTLSVRLDALTSGGRDVISARIDRRGDDLSTDVSIFSAPDGAIARIARLGGLARVSAKGDGPLADYHLSILSTLGNYGALSGAVSGDFERLERIEVDANAVFGERLSGLARFIGSRAAIDGAFLPQDDGGALEIARVQSALGAVNGTARWRNRNDALSTVEFDIDAAFAPEWRPDIQRWTGDRADLKGEVRPDGKAWRATVDLDAPRTYADAENIETDLRDYAKGPAVVRFAADEAFPTGLKRGAEAKGNFEVVFADGAASEDLNLVTTDGGAFRGAAAYQFDAETFSVDGDASLPPAFLASLNSNLKAGAAASADIDIAGTADDFAGEIIATTPRLSLDGKPLPAARAALKFSGMPSAPDGTIAVRAKDGRRLNAKFARADGFWRASGIDYRGRDFSLTGSASFNPDSKEGSADLLYRGGENAEPWPGVKLSGAMAAKGSLDEDAANNQFSVHADNVASGRIALTGFSATAAGSMDALGVKAEAAGVAIGGLSPVLDVTAAMTARLGESTTVTVSAFDAELGGAPFALTAPMKLFFADGVAVENLRARMGRTGALSFDGAFAPTGWRGELQAKRAPIVSAASIVDLDLVLDTDKEVPAEGGFTLISILTKTEEAALSGVFRWDGRTLFIRDDDSTPALDLNLQLPLALRRAPSIGVEMEGPLQGGARYSGRAETIAAFLPTALQSIEGALTFNGTATGTLADPELSGELAISDGAYTEIGTGLSIVGVDGTATASGALSGSRVDFRATARGPAQSEKTITANGSLVFGENARVASTIRLDGARLSAGPVNAATLSGVVDLSGSFSDLQAKGEITVQSLDANVITPEGTGLVAINVVPIDAAGRPSTAIETQAARPTTLSYDIAFEGDDRIFVRGRGLTSEWRVDGRIVGRADDPVVLGTMTLRDGEIQFAGRRFAMTDGSIAFDRLSPNNPALDLRAERETSSGVLAAIRIEGRARAPEITLESTPSLPQEDIMALLLFDKPASELSALESLQVAESLAELSGIGPFGGTGLTGSARAALGLDVLSFDFDEADSSASSLTVGKYVADGLFVSATQDARGQNGSVRIEYEINNDFTVETELRQDGDQTVSANWKHDF